MVQQYLQAMYASSFRGLVLPVVVADSYLILTIDSAGTMNLGNSKQHRTI